MLAVGSRAGRVYLWDVDSMASSPLHRIQHAKCSSPVRQIAFSPNGRFLVYSCDDASLWRFDLGPAESFQVSSYRTHAPGTARQLSVLLPMPAI